MAGQFYKPQSPLELDGNYIYPLTYFDQIILPNGGRWSGTFAEANHEHTNYMKISNIVYSDTEPSGSKGMIWLKPAE